MLVGRPWQPWGSDGVASFSTKVGIAGDWTGAPPLWSYSSLRAAEQCPRRLGLQRAEYPEVWDRHGYPDRTTEHSLVGTAIHEGVEVVIRALQRAGCASVADERAIHALRDLGGFSNIAASATERALAGLEGNPRSVLHKERLEIRLARRLPEMRSTVQALASRVSLLPPQGGQPARSEADKHVGERRAIGPGTHPEAVLTVETERLTGRVDLLSVGPDSVGICDFKSGKRDDHHADQLLMYGLMWMEDTEANPSGLPVRSLTVSYRDQDEQIPVPPDWDGVLQAVRDRVAAAGALISKSPPPARPSEDCWRCSVRHLCDEYWTSEWSRDSRRGPYVDLEVQVVERNGSASWNGMLLDDDSEVLLRTTQSSPDLEIDSSVRILDAMVSEAEDTEYPIATLGPSSEVYELV